MKTEMVMPQMGESIAEATILKWHKGVGDEVRKDETILEISTDKVDSEIPAPATGTIVEVRAQTGQTVPVKSVIAIIDTDGGTASKQTEQLSSPPPPSLVQKETSIKKGGMEEAAPLSSPSTRTDARPAETSVLEKRESAAGACGDRFYSPLVKSLAAQNGLSEAELNCISGTGAQGRVTKSDVMGYLEERKSPPAGGLASRPTASSPGASKVKSPPTSRPEYNTAGIRVEPMDNMRKRIAEHMVRSKATSPHVYSVAEVDVTNIVRARQLHADGFLSRESFKLSFTPFFLESVVKGLVQFPYINASVDGDNIILKKSINLGCAVALGTTGLIVPVIKNADQLSFVGIARALNDLAARARSKKLSPDETQGGTFTVTNPGVFGNIMGLPIINQPQVAILGIGAIKKRVGVVNEMIAIREMVYLTLSYDHRLVDGSLSGQYLQYLTKYLEEWEVERELY